MLGVQPRSFGFAGTKDKRAVTTQRVTVFKQRASKLAALNERLIGIKVGNFCYVNEGLVLGQLQGNRFTITLRSIVAETGDIVRASVTALEKKGFINYFGLQRFGSSSIATHLIGAALLRGEWKAAVSMILDPREGEKDVTKKIREYYKESGDIEGTLRQLPRYMVAERAILHCLQKFPGNYLQALSAIPRTLRMMFVHSYQSYLWNHAASVRIQNYGFDQVVLGDLVRCKEQESQKEMTSSHSTCEDGIDNNDTLVDCHLDEISITDLSEAKNMSVKVISDEDIVAEKYTIDDIVLPLPGSRITYPLNDIGKIYHDLAKKDGISLTDSAHNSKEFSLTNMTGAYRQVFQKPKDFEWELLNYVDTNIPLAETDWDVISKSGTSSTSVRPSDEREQIKSDREEDKTQTDESIAAASKTQMALKMSFTLPSSCYATMAIRELLKTSTSVCCVPQGIKLISMRRIIGGEKKNSLVDENTWPKVTWKTTAILTIMITIAAAAMAATSPPPPLISS
ncbi:pseudouridylate synthase 7 homolog [Phtheirospermum japonicum]|uniref:Pseudouridylate synthase 7 homolog n=1 Tax=Phtheirospermum japonicum TaxID=374723 RepID=A0A830CEN8_9LAMI|nr:pseudouridylate synthase 7 homolog [Phtheirospermum japonicum]